MAEFNYTEYIKNNPLLQEEVKDKLLTESQEVSEEAPSSKTTVSELKAQIKEMILSSLAEVEKPDGRDVYFGADAKEKRQKRVDDAVADLKKHKEKYGLKEDEDEVDPDGMDIFFGADAKDKIKKRREDAVDFLKKHKEKYGLKEKEEDIEVDIEDEIEVDAEPSMEPTIDATPEVGLSKDEQEIQNSLKLAYDNAVAIGDDKLADQIGNSITFFTRTHVVER